MGNATSINVITVQPHLPATQLHARPARSQRLMQDIVRPAKQAALAAKQQARQQASGPHKQLPIKAAVTPLSPLKHHSPQPAKTLMRRIVSKPQPGFKRQVNISTPTTKLPVNIAVVPKRSIQVIDPIRNNRAQQVGKSDKIHKFAPEKQTWFTGHESAAVKVQRPAEVAKAAATPMPNRSMDIFQKAVDRATSHQQPPVTQRQHAKAVKQKQKLAQHSVKPVHHRLPTILATSLAVLLIAGFIIYLNRPAITLRFADAKAGFHAQLPAWTPAGFGINKFKYDPGTVAVDYSRSGTSRHYTFSQSTSKLTTDSLEHTIIPHNAAYQTLQNGGHTIYIYGNNNAAWLSQGMLYKITSNGSLSTSDILSIATSV